MKLLIAEDEKDLAEALSVFLEKNLYTVDTVHNGADAYEYASTGAYDAIILDIMMPKLNGLQVLSRLREDGVATPVMLLTAKGQKDDRIAGFDAGADDYLPKPFAPDELCARLRVLTRAAYGAALPDTANTDKILVGPEGGFSDAEFAALDAAGAVGISLGKTILRAELAAAIALGRVTK